MVRPDDSARKERHSGNLKTSVKAPPKKAGGGGRFTMGKVGEDWGGATYDRNDPNFDPDERRVDPDDGVAYKFDELAAFYKGKFSKQTIAEYWEYECTVARRKARKAASASVVPAGPTLQESAAQAKYRPKAPAQPKPEHKRLSDEDTETDGPLAKEVAAVIPYFPYQKLEKYYDIQGLLKHPKLFNAVCAVLGKRFKSLGVTKIAAFEARGFLFAPVSVRIGVPFILLRTSGKLPNTISSKEQAGVDTICVQRGAINEGDKVALVDDFVATGDSFCAGIELMKACQAEVVECASLVELKALNGREKCLKAGAKNMWSFISEDLLTTKADV